MNHYDFELIFRLKSGEDPSQHLDALYEAGCDDATISTGTPGIISLRFSREAPSADTAMTSAIDDARKAIPHAAIDRAEPYLLNLSELASELGFTKQNMSKYACNRAARTQTVFPKPYIEGKVSRWSYFEVAVWLAKEKIVVFDNDELRTLGLIWSLNRAIEDIKHPSNEKKIFTELLLKSG